MKGHKDAVDVRRSCEKVASGAFVCVCDWVDRWCFRTLSWKPVDCGCQQEQGCTWHASCCLFQSPGQEGACPSTVLVTEGLPGRCGRLELMERMR